MRLSTRLLLTLLPAATLVMAAYAFWALTQREDVLGDEERSETRAFSTAVGVAFEHAFRDLQFRDVQDILDEVSQQPRIYGLFVYDTLGVVVMASTGLDARGGIERAAVLDVVRDGQLRDLDRQVGEEQVFSVLYPIRAAVAGGVTGVLEVVQPYSFIREEKVRTAQRFLLNTVTLLAVLGLLTVWVVRERVDRPLRDLIAGIRQLGRGDLSHRLAERGSVRELGELSGEFNRMADALEDAMGALVVETEDRMRLESRLQEQERLAAMGTLAGGVAHQISAPLNVIGGRARLALGALSSSSEPSPRDLERHLGAILDQSDRIERIVRGLLGYAEHPRPMVRPTALAPVVHAAIGRVSAEFADAETPIETTVPASTELVTDPDLLEEVVVILLTNAVQALEGETGSVRVETRASGGSLRLAVHDSGAGVTEERAALVFNAFFTTRPGGTGLGLAVARTIVDRLGGEIGVEPGATGLFWIELPLGGSAEDA